MGGMERMYGTFLRELRQSRSLSQGDLAAVVGISQPNISAYERDRRVPPADTLNRLVVACGYQLVARAGDRSVACGLPRAGWFPDEGDPPRLPDDPIDEAPTIDERVAAINAVLELASANP